MRGDGAPPSTIGAPVGSGNSIIGLVSIPVYSSAGFGLAFNRDNIWTGTFDPASPSAVTWKKWWGEANTTVDTNGFIKRASPVVKLFGTGEIECNDEAEGVTASREAAGVYRVTGSCGLNSEGWTVEIPQDINGNFLGLGSSATKNVGTSVGNVMEVGAFGFGGKGNSFNADTVAEVWANLMDKGSRVFRNNKTVNSQTSYAASLYFAAEDTHAIISVAYGTGVVGVLARNTSGTSATSTFNMLYGTANTTRASDGTLKTASPVVKLFADGSFETNEESEGCTVTRIKTGEYLIEGCMGLNSDAAWGGIDGGFDIPKDRNRQALIWLDYEVSADGSVLVKTFHREYPTTPAFARNSLEGYADGDPADIPADQYVSVRVEMPQNSISNLHAAMVEVPDSSAA